MASNREQLIIDLTLNKKGLQKDLAAVNRQLTGMGVKAERSGRRAASGMKSFGSSIKTALISTRALIALLGVGIIGRFAIKEVVAFSKGMAEVATIVDTAKVSMSGLRRGVIDLANAHGKNSKEIAKGLYQTISAGITDATEAMVFLTEAQELATAGLSSTTDAVDGLTSVINAYNLPVTEAARISDIFFQTVRRGKTTIPELTSSIGQVTPVAAALGVSFEEVSAGLATITLAGVSTSEAVTQMRSVMRNLQKKSDEINKVFQRIGRTFDDTTLETHGLVTVLGWLREATGNSSTELTKLLTRAEATSAVFNLTGKNAAKFVNILGDVEDAAGATDAAMRKIQDSPGDKLLRWANALKNDLVEAAEAFLVLTTDIEVPPEFSVWQTVKSGGSTRESFMEGVDAVMSAAVTEGILKGYADIGEVPGVVPAGESRTPAETRNAFLGTRVLITGIEKQLESVELLRTQIKLAAAQPEIDKRLAEFFDLQSERFDRTGLGQPKFREGVLGHTRSEELQIEQDKEYRFAVPGQSEEFYASLRESPGEFARRRHSSSGVDSRDPKSLLFGGHTRFGRESSVDLANAALETDKALRLLTERLEKTTKAHAEIRAEREKQISNARALELGAPEVQGSVLALQREFAGAAGGRFGLQHEDAPSVFAEDRGALFNTARLTEDASVPGGVKIDLLFRVDKKEYETTTEANAALIAGLEHGNKKAAAVARGIDSRHDRTSAEIDISAQAKLITELKALLTSYDGDSLWGTEEQSRLVVERMLEIAGIRSKSDADRKKANEEDRKAFEDRTEEAEAAKAIRDLQKDRDKLLVGGDFGAGLSEKLRRIREESASLGALGAEFGDNIFDTMTDSVNELTTAILTGEDAGEAFFNTLVQGAISAAASFAGNYITGGFLGLFGGSQGGVAPGGFAQGGVEGYATGGIQGYATGGMDPRDVVPAMVRPGEGFIRPEAVRAIGSGAIDYINSTGRIPGSGGGGTQISFGGITVNGGGQDGEQTARSIMDQMARMIRGNENSGFNAAVKSIARKG